MKPASLLRLPVRAYRRLVGSAAPQPPTGVCEIEALRLRAIPRIPCDTSNLGNLSEAALRGILAAPELAAAWEEERPRLDGLDLPEHAQGVNPGDRRALFHLALGLRPASVLEFGTHVGCSTVHLASALRRLGNRQLLSVDIADMNDPATRPWQRFGARLSPREACAAIGGDFVHFQVADSLAYLRSCEQKHDLIFLDGDHSATQVYQEIPLALAHLNPDGFILLHDYFPNLRPLWSKAAVIPGPFLAVQRLVDEGVGLKALPLGELPWPTKLGSCLTSLALLSRGA